MFYISTIQRLFLPFIFLALMLVEFLINQLFDNFYPRLDYIYIFISSAYLRTHLNYTSLFLLGVTKDVLYISPIGVTSLVYIVFSYFISNVNRANIIKYHVLFFINMFITTFMQWVMYSIFYKKFFPTFDFILTLFSTFFLLIIGSLIYYKNISLKTFKLFYRN